jgi:hypothetical protein
MALRLNNPVLLVRPVVVLAAKFVGTGPLRLKLVKLAHELDDDRVRFDTTRRAA